MAGFQKKLSTADEQYLKVLSIRNIIEKNPAFPFTVNQSLTGKHLKGRVDIKKWEGKQSENTEGCQITQELN